MNRLFKVVETRADGQKTGRIGYLLRPKTLPIPAPGFEWQENAAFNVADAILNDGSLKEVFRAAIKCGHAIVGPAT